MYMCATYPGTGIDEDELGVIIKHAACHELNPATDYGVGTKFGFDCTVKPGQEERNKKVAFQDVDLSRYDIV